VNEETQGLVEIKYRTGLEPAQPPNVQAIQRQMAIVAWQPGPNRILHVPSEVGLTNTSVFAPANDKSIANLHAQANRVLCMTLPVLACAASLAKPMLHVRADS